MALRAWLFGVVYALIGFNLPAQQLLTNYLLEIAPLELHPNYLGMYNALRSITLIFPPVIGFLMDALSFDKIFLGLAVFLSVGIVLAYWLIEPRHMADKDEYKEEMALGVTEGTRLFSLLTNLGHGCFAGIGKHPDLRTVAAEIHPVRGLEIAQDRQQFGQCLILAAQIQPRAAFGLARQVLQCLGRRAAGEILQTSGIPV